MRLEGAGLGEHGPWETNDRELRNFGGSNPSPLGYGFRLYVGP